MESCPLCRGQAVEWPLRNPLHVGEEAEVAATTGRVAAFVQDVTEQCMASDTGGTVVAFSGWGWLLRGARRALANAGISAYCSAEYGQVDGTDTAFASSLPQRVFLLSTRERICDNVRRALKNTKWVYFLEPGPLPWLEEAGERRIAAIVGHSDFEVVRFAAASNDNLEHRMTDSSLRSSALGSLAGGLTVPSILGFLGQSGVVRVTAEGRHCTENGEEDDRISGRRSCMAANRDVEHHGMPFGFPRHQLAKDALAKIGEKRFGSPCLCLYCRWMIHVKTRAALCFVHSSSLILVLFVGLLLGTARSSPKGTEFLVFSLPECQRQSGGTTPAQCLQRPGREGRRGTAAL